MATKYAGKGYKSPVDLGLPRLPQINDSNLFPEFLVLYNACHTLNAYLDSLRIVLEGGDPTQTPDETMRFLRGFWIPAAQDITAGTICTPHGGQLHKGAGSSGAEAFLTGICVTDTPAGDPARFAIGPGIINVPGFPADAWVWAPVRGQDQAGFVFTEPPPDEADIHAIRIGRAVMADYVLLMPDLSQN